MVQWNDEAHSKLLRAIISKAKLTAADYEYIAEVIGEGCTVKAVRNHVSRLMNGRGGSGATPDASPAKPKTPNGKGRAGKPPANVAKSPATKKRKKAERIYGSEASSDVDAPETPKKIKADEEITVVENEDNVDNA